MRLLLLIIICLNNPFYGFANDHTIKDHVIFPLEVMQDTTESDSINPNGFFSLFKGKPGKAALLALLIPSAGQIYNKKWWKVPLALALDGSLTYVLIHNRNQYNFAEERYLNTLRNEPNNPDLNNFREARDVSRKWSEYSWLWLIGGHLLTIIDAFVDRHMMGFDISTDLSMSQDMLGINGSGLMHVGVKINLQRTEQHRTIHPLFPIAP